MKVLKKVRPQQGWAQKSVCTGHGNGMGGCGAKLLIEQGDLFITTSSARDEVDSHITYRCPECGVNTDIDFDLVPGNIRASLRKGMNHPKGGFCHPDMFSETE